MELHANVQRPTINVQHSIQPPARALPGVPSKTPLSKRRVELSLKPYAEANCAKQNTQSSSQTF
jgi:hypothetical protein